MNNTSPLSSPRSSESFHTPRSQEDESELDEVVNTAASAVLRRLPPMPSADLRRLDVPVQFERTSAGGYRRAVSLVKEESSSLQQAMKNLWAEVQIGPNQTFHHLHLKTESKTESSAGYLYMQNDDGSLSKIVLHSGMNSVKELMRVWDDHSARINPKQKGRSSGWWVRPQGVRGNQNGQMPFARTTEHTRKLEQTKKDSEKAHKVSIHDGKPLSQAEIQKAETRKQKAHALIHGMKAKLKAKHVDNRLDELCTYAIDCVFDNPILIDPARPFNEKIILIDRFQQRINQEIHDKHPKKWFSAEGINEEEVKQLSVDIATAIPLLLDDHLDYEAALKYFHIQGSKKDSLEKAIIDLTVAQVDNNGPAIERALQSPLLTKFLTVEELKEILSNNP